MAKILISGGSGLIGKALIKKLVNNNHEVSTLSRNSNSIENTKVFIWDTINGKIDERAFENIDYIIHLAGAGIADKRWTKERKEEIIDSRVVSTQLLLSYVKKLKTPLKGFISASAVGYYGAITSENTFTENDSAGKDFLGTVCKLWEDSILEFKKLGVPITILRTGIVLSNNGGALEKMKTPVITPIGSGKQIMPWIHIEDLCQLYLDAVNKKIVGIYNAVAPDYHTNKSFSKTLAKSFHRIFIPFGAPSILFKIIFGELAVILLTGSKISSKKLIESGFKFQFPNLENALLHLAKNKKV